MLYDMYIQGSIPFCLSEPFFKFVVDCSNFSLDVLFFWWGDIEKHLCKFKSVQYRVW